jgi:CRISPR-associated protein Cas2
MRYVIIYDISDDKTRRDVFTTLKSYGAWKQYSAFEVDLTDTQRTELLHELSSLITEDEHIRIYRICGTCEKHIEELGKTTNDSSSTVV